MCGAPAPTIAPIQASLEDPSEPNHAGRTPEEVVSREQPLEQAETQDSGKSIGIGIAVVVVLLVPVFLVVHNWQTSKLNEPAASVTNTQPQSNSEQVAALTGAARNHAKRVHTPVPANQQAETTIPTTEDDPAELWKSVRGGSARAEVTLAKLYLEGNEVPQSCEQTHMLLLAASKKGYKPADSLLTGAYVERCQQSSAQ